MGRRRIVRQLLAVGADNTDALVRAGHQDDPDAVVELIKRCERDRSRQAWQWPASAPQTRCSWTRRIRRCSRSGSSSAGSGERANRVRGVASQPPHRLPAARSIPEMRERRRQAGHRATTTLDELEVRASDDHIVSHDLLAEVLRRLSSEDREVLVLRLVQELSTSQTAELCTSPKEG